MMNRLFVILLTILLVIYGFSCANKSKIGLIESWEVGTATGILNDFSQEEIDELSEAGIKYIEMGSRVFADKSYDERVAFVNDIKTKTEKSGIELWSVHLPFSNVYDISTLNDEHRNAMLNECIEIFKLWQPLNPRKFVIHPSAEPISDKERIKRIENSIASLGILTNEIQKYKGSKLALENLPRTCLGNTAEELLMIVNSVGNGLEVCFDSNHMLHELPAEFISKVGSFITTVHMSDYDYVDGLLDERHWLPGEGMINWTSVISVLLEIGYQGPFMFETSRRKPDPITNERERLTATELVANWKELKDDQIKFIKLR